MHVNEEIGTEALGTVVRDGNGTEFALDRSISGKSASDLDGFESAVGDDLAIAVANP